MPGLQGALSVLKHNLNEIVQIESKSRSSDNISSTTRVSRNAIPSKDTCDVELISKLQRCIRHSKWHAVNCISLLPANHRCGIGKHQRPCLWNSPIVVRSLGIWPRRICSQIPSSDQKHTYRFSLLCVESLNRWSVDGLLPDAGSLVHRPV